MPGKKNQKQKAEARWSRNGEFAAQLFRDIYFGKYKPGADGKYDALEIFNDPERDYKKLSQTNFYGHIEQVATRVDQYKTSGTGLETDKFRRLVDLDNPPSPVDREPALAEEEDEEYDSDYEEDIEGTDKELEDIEEQELEAEAEPKKKTKPKKTTTIKEAVMSSGDTKYLAKEPDGRLVGCIHLPSGFDGTIAFNDGDKKNKVLLKENQQRWKYNAQRVFEQKGLDRNNVHVVAMQAVMDKQKIQDIIDMGENPDSFRGTIVKTRVVFDLKKDADVAEVTPFFYDEYGNETDDIAVDGNDSEWAFFWMMDASKVNKPKPKAARLVRNRNRRRETKQNNVSPRSRSRPNDAGSRRGSPRRRAAVPMDEDSTYFYFDAEEEDDDDAETVDVSL